MKMAKSREHCAFPHSVFQRLVMQTSKNKGLFGKDLNHAEENYSRRHCGENRKDENASGWGVSKSTRLEISQNQSRNMSISRNFIPLGQQSRKCIRHAVTKV